MKRLYSLILLLFCFGIGKAQYTVLLNFNNTNGANPESCVTVAGNKIFGVALQGGSNGVGCVFTIDTNGNNYKKLMDCPPAFNVEPNACQLVLIGKVLYGFNTNSTVNAWGNIFAIDTDGTGYQDLYDFANATGGIPASPFILYRSKFYGSTTYGGKSTDKAGTIFSINTNGSNYIDLFDLSIASGYEPGPLTISGSMIYGINRRGGKYNKGNIFSLDTNGFVYKSIVDFNDTNGSDPISSSLTLLGNKLYGVTCNGGDTTNLGIVFSVDTNGTAFKILYNFDQRTGYNPIGQLANTGNTLYGVTQGGGTQKCSTGLIYAIDTTGSKFRHLCHFLCTDGALPENGLTLSGRNLYGMTYFGGLNNHGVVYKIDTASIDTTSLYVDTTTFSIINELTVNARTVTLFPNPSKGRFIISFSHPELVSGSHPKVEVYNVLGEKVYDAVLNPPAGGQHDDIVDLSARPSGIYLYRIISETGALISTGKLILQK